MLLNKYDATVSLCHSKTENIEDYIRNADVFISAIGQPRYFKGDWFKKGAIAIDIGINEIFEPDNSGKIVRKIVGDIDFEEAIETCGHITPVPGGVGPMTIAMLMNNVFKSWLRINY